MKGVLLQEVDLVIEGLNLDDPVGERRFGNLVQKLLFELRGEYEVCLAVGVILRVVLQQKLNGLFSRMQEVEGVVLGIGLAL